MCFTGIVYAREIGGSTHTFGVSGKLIMNALVMYDHQTDTLWSQFLSRGVKGPLTGVPLEIVPSLQTTWSQWLQLHPETLVLDKGGGSTRDHYEGYYQRGDAGIIGESNKDNRLPRKELVVGLNLGGRAIAYPFRTMVDQPVINDYFAGKDLLVTFEPLSEPGVVFDRRLDGRTLSFRPLTNEAFQILFGSNTDPGATGLPLENHQTETPLMQDIETRSVWQALTGRAIEGPLQGAVLTREPSHYSFWFAWSDFHPETELYGPDTP